MYISRKKISDELKEQYPDMSDENFAMLVDIVFGVAKIYGKRVKELYKRIGDRPLDQILLNHHFIEYQIKKYKELGADKLVSEMEEQLKKINDELLDRYSDIKKLVQG